MVSLHAPHPSAWVPNRTGCTSQHSNHRAQSHVSRRITVATELRERGTRRPSTVSPVLSTPPPRAYRFVPSTSFKSVAFRSEDFESIMSYAPLMMWLNSFGWRTALAFAALMVGVYQEGALSFLLLIATSFALIGADVAALARAAL
jgi:hypothetical protein